MLDKSDINAVSRQLLRFLTKPRNDSKNETLGGDGPNVTCLDSVRSSGRNGLSTHGQ
jgi:hypothetical protein